MNALGDEAAWQQMARPRGDPGGRSDARVPGRAVRARGVAVRSRRACRRTHRAVRRPARAHGCRPAAPHRARRGTGDVAAQFYRPDGRFSRTVLLLPGIHSMGIDEPAADVAREGPGRQGRDGHVDGAAGPAAVHQITPRSTEMIEDAVGWLSRRSDLAPGRPHRRHRDQLRRRAVDRRRRTAVDPRQTSVRPFIRRSRGSSARAALLWRPERKRRCPGVENHPPHDYGVAVILYGLADQGIVPAEQVVPLRQGVEIFLLASQLTLRDINQANAMFQKARDYAKTLPEPAATYMTYVNDRNVSKLGPALVPYLGALGADSPAISADRAPSVPTAPVFLLHGRGDTVIPAAESAQLAEYLRGKGADVHLLVSELITHAEIDQDTPPPRKHGSSSPSGPMDPGTIAVHASEFASRFVFNVQVNAARACRRTGPANTEREHESEHEPRRKKIEEEGSCPRRSASPRRSSRRRASPRAAPRRN